jgi:TonB family protein
MFRLCAFALALGFVAQQEPAFTPARLQDGRVPPISVTAVGGGEVRLEVDVSAEGLVTRVTPLRTTPPFTDLMTAAVHEWKFFPARAVVNGDAARNGAQIARAAVPATVLVVGMFRPPAMNVPTLGESAKDLTSGSDATPFPASTTMPPYPPRAFGSGVVLLEARVSAIGSVDDVGVIASSPAFDEAARDTVRKWHFRPAKRDGIPVAALVYVIAAFRSPVTSGRYP